MERDTEPNQASGDVSKKEQRRSWLLASSQIRLLTGLLIVSVIAAATWFFVARRPRRR